MTPGPLNPPAPAFPQATEGGAQAASVASSTLSPVALFGFLLDRFAEVVGPDAGAATFHYAALREGLRLGAAAKPAGPDAAWSILSALVGPGSQVAERGGMIRVELASPGLLDPPGPVRMAVVRGLTEGILRAVRGRPYKVLVLPGPPPSLECREEP